MHDNGSFVSVPPLGSGINELEVAADDNVARTRTMKQLMIVVREEINACGLPLGSRPYSSSALDVT